MSLLIFLFVWLTFSAILHKLLLGAIYSATWKQWLANLLTLPSIWFDYLARKTINGTVGGWFLQLAAWLQE